MRFALQADDPNTVSCRNFSYVIQHLMLTETRSQLPSYALLSRQTLPNEKPIEEIVLVPGISRALILSGM